MQPVWCFFSLGKREVFIELSNKERGRNFFDLLTEGKATTYFLGRLSVMVSKTASVALAFLYGTAFLIRLSLPDSITDAARAIDIAEGPDSFLEDAVDYVTFPCVLRAFLIRQSEDSFLLWSEPGDGPIAMVV